MIGRPTTPQLLQSIKAELNDKIGPALSDPTHVVAVQMMGAMLDALSVRTENELAWMRDECEAIETAASAFVDANPTSAGVATALDGYRAGRSESLKLSDVQADYDRATEVLSCLADAAYATGSVEAIGAVEMLVEQRLATELAIVGTFVAAGRE